MQTRPEGEPPPGWAVAAVLGTALGLAYLLRFVLLPLVFAAALAFVLGPLVTVLSLRLRVPRFAAVLVVYGAVLALTGSAAWWIATSLGDRVVTAAANAPALLSGAIGRLFGPDVHAFGRTVSADDLARQVLAGFQAWLGQPGAAVTAGAVAVAVPATAVLMLVVLFYLLQSGRRVAEGVLWLAPPPYRPILRAHGRRIEPMLRQYVRGLLLVVAYASGAAWLVLGPVFHLPFAAVLAVTVGVLELVPVVGPAASMALIGGGAVLDGGGPWAVFGAMAFAVGLRLSIDEIVGPLVLGRAVSLPPVVIIVAFLVGSALFGVLGALLAVPVAASVKIVLAALYGEDGSA